MHQVFQPVLQTVELTGGFLAKHRLALANLAQHVTARGVLGSCSAAELQVS